MTMVTLEMPRVSRLQEIAQVLLKARNEPHYQMGSAHALDHLLVHVVGALEDIDLHFKALERTLERQDR